MREKKDRLIERMRGRCVACLAGASMHVRREESACSS